VEIIELVSGDARARVCSKGAHVMDAEFGGVPLLWLSPMASLQAETPGVAIRGGVPLCFPWFGKDPWGGPAHGFARNRDWRLADRSAGRAVFALDDDAETRELWPHPFHAELTVRLDSVLTFTFEVTNTGIDDAPFTYALHSYFAAAPADGTAAQDDHVHPGRPPGAAVHGLDGCIRTETTGGTSTQEGDIIVDGYVDAIFQQVPPSVAVSGAGSTIQVYSDDMTSAIVWNPGPNAMPDIRDGWREFVCVERGRVGPAGVVLPPGATYAATMRLGLFTRASTYLTG
jgi:glucose-6-phosphate 1-epimerase